MKTGPLIVLSLLAHGGVFYAVSNKAKEMEKRHTLIAVVEQKKKAEEEKKKPPPKPIEAPKELLRARPAPAPVPEAPPPPTSNAKPSAAMEAMPDYGLNFGGGGAGDGPGLAVPKGNPGGNPAAPKASAGPKEKVLGPSAAAAAGDVDLAAEIANWKPKPLASIKPVYPDEARSAEIEGTVTVEVRIDCTGKVIEAKIITSLGHGLDESALLAAKKTEFEPAPRCAKGFEKTKKMNYAFRLGD